MDEWVPSLKFNETVHDFGRVNEEGDINYYFTFINEESYPILISDARAGCSCTVPVFPKQPIQPGAKSEIMVKYDTKHKSGEFSKEILLTIKDDAKKKTAYIPLYIQGYVIPANLKN